MKEYVLENAWLSDGWAANVHISISTDGEITQINPHCKNRDIPLIKGYAIPGIPNTHSHAFQRALSGLTEFSSGNEDNFWTWRKMMYALSGKIDPQTLYQIAAQLYVEMLKAGYTTVAEFHYLHHQADGSFYASQAEMAQAILQAARDTGIGLSLLPTLYMSSGFANQAVLDQQKRFYHSVEDYCRLFEILRNDFSEAPGSTLGCAFHSLRAVTPEALAAVLDYIPEEDAVPLHIHIAEQVQEVEDCLNWSGLRPVEWLLEHHDIDSRWSLVHATHINDSEIRKLAASEATVCICPTTEANLGDGIFPLAAFLDAGGNIAIGSDSNTSISAVEEMRWLEYGQRLAHKKRTIVNSDKQASCGADLLRRILAGGAKACAQNIGALACGYRADILFLDRESNYLAEKPLEYILDSFVFSGNDSLVKDVMCGGNRVVQNFQHDRQTEINDAYKNTIKKLYRDLV